MTHLVIWVVGSLVDTKSCAYTLSNWWFKPVGYSIYELMNRPDLFESNMITIVKGVRGGGLKSFFL